MNWQKNPVTLVGGPCDGITVILPPWRLWYCHCTFTDQPGKIVGSKVLEWHQYAKDGEGIWRPIDGTHPLYII